MAGAGLGFGAGLAKGIANAISGHRAEQTRQRERQEDVDWRNFQSTFPVIFQNFQDNPGPESAAAVEDLITRVNPEMKKLIKKSGFSFESLGPLLQQPAQPAHTEIIPGTPGIPRQVEAQPATLPATSGAAVQRPGPPTLFGMPVLTNEQKAERGAMADPKVALARRLMREAGISFEEALDRVGLQPRLTAGMRPQSIRGTLPDGTPAFGIFDPTRQGYFHPDTGERLTGFRPLTSEATQTFGVDREALSMAMYNKPFRDLDQPQARAVIDAEQQQLQEESRRRRVGTGIGNVEAPIDVQTAQQTGTVVGAPGTEYTGQRVPTAQERTRRTTAEDIGNQLTRIKQLVNTTLPTKNELAGLTPGMANAIRKRTPAFREQYAQLESAINNIRASLTRTMQANVGTETEADAQRALSTIADFEGSLFDPLRGDTRESAQARIDETLLYLKQVLDTLPATPSLNSQRGNQPQGAPAQAAPAGPAGITNRNGILYGPDGKPLPGQ